MPRDFFGGTVKNSDKGQAEVPMILTVLEGGRVGEAPRPVVIDTGMKGHWSPSGNVYENCESPETLLAKVGLDPNEVETVILTHLHFDHIGNLDAFPNATFFVQQSEYDGWKGVLQWPDEDLGPEEPGWPLSSIYPPDFDVLDGLVEAGRVTFIDGAAEVAPGIHCHLARDSHTFGCQWVEVRGSSGPHVIAGDCVYWYENLENMWPPAYVQGNCWNLLAAYREIKEMLDGDTQRLVPGHDPLLFERHPSWVAGLNRLAEINLADGAASMKPSS
jgi:glyoxylase-like metal-dependent hydrolase (beta-lactamase superfamily II)